MRPDQGQEVKGELEPAAEVSQPRHLLDKSIPKKGSWSLRHPKKCPQNSDTEGEIVGGAKRGKNPVLRKYKPRGLQIVKKIFPKRKKGQTLPVNVEARPRSTSSWCVQQTLSQYNVKEPKRHVEKDLEAIRRAVKDQNALKSPRRSTSEKTQRKGEIKKGTTPENNPRKCECGGTSPKHRHPNIRADDHAVGNDCWGSKYATEMISGYKLPTLEELDNIRMETYESQYEVESEGTLGSPETRDGEAGQTAADSNRK
ncbi:hypothetical protein JTB14_028716 [Gonioctena quinquepunctata]|nr:hypothetical protein JTB14_028716 [Gonioctena quinquepunctata]